MTTGVGLTQLEIEAIYWALNEVWDRLLHDDAHDDLIASNTFYKLGNTLVADLTQRFNLLRETPDL
jgi:hypothetical protein